MQHPVGFVEDQHFKWAEIKVLATDQIEQASRGGDNAIDPFAQRLDLCILFHAAEDCGHSDRQTLPIGADVFHDLHRELAGGGEDQRPDSAWLLLEVKLEELVEHRQNEGRRFAGARLSDGDEVGSLHDFWDGGRLHGGWAGVPDLLNRTENRRLESKVAERHGQILVCWIAGWHGFKSSQRIGVKLKFGKQKAEMSITEAYASITEA